MPLPPGHSGYFSTPASSLDPNLFDGMHLKPEVRGWLGITLAAGLQRYLSLHGIEEWLHMWLAGSGITYQWAGDRGATGDLDVLFGVDMQAFVRHNPDYAGLPESYVADHADQVLKQKLWPRTAHQRFGQQTYEVTFFWNPGTGRDITRIHPYAAYDLRTDAWVVSPPTLPDDPRVLFPQEWYDTARQDIDAAGSLVTRHASLNDKLASIAPGTPQAVNATAELSRVQSAATSLFDEIHKGRNEAFGEQGHGYTDWHNFRWQFSKSAGIIGALKEIIHEAREDESVHDNQLYGGPITGADALLTRAMLHRRHGDR